MDVRVLVLFTALHILSKIGGQLVEKIVGTVLELLKYRRRNMEDLRTKLENLRNKRDEVQRQIDAHLRNGEIVPRRFKKWIARVNEIIEDPMFLRSRYAKEIIADVDRLIQTARRFDRESTFESRELILEEIREALDDDQISIIGIIYGEGGMGETTLVKEICEEAIDPFEKVAMAKVSSHPNLKRIQCEIANTLDLRFDEESAAGRARRLFQKLAGMKRILIILDDIWEKIELEDIGIPFGEGYTCCKILLVSRSQDVCDQSGTERDFLIEALPEDLGWKLSSKMAGVHHSQDQHDSPVHVAEKCAGLPSAGGDLATCKSTEKENLLLRDGID